MSGDSRIYNKARPSKRNVTYRGTVLPVKGYNYYYNSDSGTAAAATEDRCRVVEQLSVSNNLWYAGVAARSCNEGEKYDKDGTTFSVDFEINPPGEYAYVYCNSSVTLDTGVLTPVVGQWYMKTGLIGGEGSAIPKQTLDTATTAANVWCRLMTGVPSGGQELKTCAAAGGATVPMVGGLTRFQTQTLAANATFTLADGSYAGQFKVFVLDGAQTTNSIVGTVTSPALIGAVAVAGYDVWTATTTSHKFSGLWNGIGWIVSGVTLA